MLSPGLHRRQSRREHSQSDFFFFFFFLSEEGFPLELTWMHRGFLKSPHGSRSLAMANAEPSHTNKQKKEGKNIGRTLDVTHDTRRRLSDRAWVCFPPTCVGHVGSSGRSAGWAADWADCSEVRLILATSSSGALWPIRGGGCEAVWILLLRERKKKKRNSSHADLYQDSSVYIPPKIHTITFPLWAFYSLQRFIVTKISHSLQGFFFFFCATVQILGQCVLNAN